MVNNAGIAVMGATAEVDIEAFDRMLAITECAIMLVAAMAPGMAARGHGSIISVSSMASRVGMPGGAAYAATKASLEAMTRAWTAKSVAAGYRGEYHRARARIHRESVRPRIYADDR